MKKFWIIDPSALLKGGPGSGFHGHAGRPGEVGGSAAAGTAPAAAGTAESDAAAADNWTPEKIAAKRKAFLIRVFGSEAQATERQKVYELQREFTNPNRHFTPEELSVVLASFEKPKDGYTEDRRGQDMFRREFFGEDTEVHVAPPVGKVEPAALTRAKNFLGQLLPDWPEKNGQKIEYKTAVIETERSYYDDETRTVYVYDYAEAVSYVHEIGHGLELDSFVDGKPLWVRNQNYRDRLANGKEPVPLSSLGVKYKDVPSDEMVYAGIFKDPYMGKKYFGMPTEVFSVGLEKLFSDPARFAIEEPQVFDHIVYEAKHLRGKK